MSDSYYRDLIVIGYYGRGNLGDDLLASYVIGALQKVIAPQRIMVIAPPGNYIDKWFPGIQSVSLPYAFHHRTESPKRLVYGGGGMFYDFRKPTLSNLWGAHGNLMWHCWRHAGSELKNGLRTYAFCVGVGPLKGCGARWITRKLLSTFDRVSVRDEQSARLVSPIRCAKVTDPVLGLYRLLSIRGSRNQKLVGFVIRYWPSSDKLIYNLHESAGRLRKEGLDVTFISFEQQGDACAIELLNKLGERRVLCWDPNKQDIESFCESLSQFCVLITMRAHAVILGAILGLKVIGISIEPKIGVFITQFGNPNFLLDQNSTVEEICVKIVEAMNTPIVMRDMNAEKKLLEQEEQHLLDWVCGVK